MSRKKKTGRKTKHRRQRREGYVEATLSTKDVAMRLGVRIETVWTWIKRKELTAYWVGRWRFTERDIDAFLLRRRNKRGGEEAE